MHRCTGVTTISLVEKKHKNIAKLESLKPSSLKPHTHQRCAYAHKQRAGANPHCLRAHLDSLLEHILREHCNLIAERICTYNAITDRSIALDYLAASIQSDV